jgi:hypothetical protein
MDETTFEPCRAEAFGILSPISAEECFDAIVLEMGADLAALLKQEASR